MIAWNAGDDAALERLVPLVYSELRRTAARRLRRERPDHTLQTTALVHETYLRLVEQRRARWRNRAQFFAVAARLMRRILVDHARSRGASKRGGQAWRVSVDADTLRAPEAEPEVVALDRALQDLASLDKRQSQIVELRYFGGLSIEETAQTLGLSPATVKREWTVARAWLHQRVRGERSTS